MLHFGLFETLGAACGDSSAPRRSRHLHDRVEHTCFKVAPLDHFAGAVNSPLPTFCTTGTCTLCVPSSFAACDHNVSQRFPLNSMRYLAERQHVASVLPQSLSQTLSPSSQTWPLLYMCAKYKTDAHLLSYAFDVQFVASKELHKTLHAWFHMPI